MSVSDEARALAVQLVLSSAHRPAEKLGCRLFPGAARTCWKEMMLLVHPDRCRDPRAAEAFRMLKEMEPQLIRTPVDAVRQSPRSDLEERLHRALPAPKAAPKAVPKGTPKAVPKGTPKAAPKVSVQAWTSS